MSVDAGGLLDIGAAAQWLGISPGTIADRRWRERNGLRGLKVGRRLLFKRSELLDFAGRRKETFSSDTDRGSE